LAQDTSDGPSPQRVDPCCRTHVTVAMATKLLLLVFAAVALWDGAANDDGTYIDGPEEFHGLYHEENNWGQDDDMPKDEARKHMIAQWNDQKRFQREYQAQQAEERKRKREKDVLGNKIRDFHDWHRQQPRSDGHHHSLEYGLKKIMKEHHAHNAHLHGYEDMHFERDMKFLVPPPEECGPWRVEMCPEEVQKMIFEFDSLSKSEEESYRSHIRRLYPKLLQEKERITQRKKAIVQHRKQLFSQGNQMLKKRGVRLKEQQLIKAQGELLDEEIEYMRKQDKFFEDQKHDYFEAHEKLARAEKDTDLAMYTLEAEEMDWIMEDMRKTSLKKKKDLEKKDLEKTMKTVKKSELKEAQMTNTEAASTTTEAASTTTEAPIPSVTTKDSLDAPSAYSPEEL